MGPDFAIYKDPNSSKPRLDTPIDEFGVFSTNINLEEKPFQANLKYTPGSGIKLFVQIMPSVLAMRCTSSNASCFDYIYGKLSNGIFVTLVNCSYFESYIYVEKAFFGILLKDVNSFIVKGYSIEYSSIFNWVDKSPFKFTGTQKGLMDELKIEASMPITVFPPNEKYAINIGNNISRRYQPDSVNFKSVSLIHILSSDGLPYNEMLEIATRIGLLLSILIDHQISIRSISIDHNTTLPESSNKFEISDQRIFGTWEVYNQVGNHDHPDVMPHNMLLPYRDIENSFSNIVNNWIIKSKQAKEVIDLFSAIRKWDLPVEFRYLFSAQILEGYHKLIVSEKKLDLGGRIKKMFERLPTEVRDWIARNPKKFQKMLVATRDYYTHLKNDGDDIIKIDTLHLECERNLAIFIANLLLDIGIEPNSLLNILMRSAKFAFCMSELSKSTAG